MRVLKDSWQGKCRHKGEESTCFSETCDAVLRKELLDTEDKGMSMILHLREISHHFGHLQRERTSAEGEATQLTEGEIPQKTAVVVLCQMATIRTSKSADRCGEPERLTEFQ